MSNQESPAPPGRRYPAFWEKAVPIALAAIAVAVVVLLVIAALVVLGTLRG